MKVMVENIKRAGKFLEQTANILLLTISMFITWGLVYYSARYTELLWDETEIPRTVVDNIAGNLMVFVAVMIIFFLLRNILLKKCHYNIDKIRRIAIAAAAVYITMVSVVWVLICHVKPLFDAEVLCEVTESILQGDYFTMIPPQYMACHPHQFSLVAVIQLLFYLFGVGNYHAFQYMNALCMPLLFYSGYKFLMLIYGKFEPILNYICFFVSFLPLFLYIPYVYGEITSITFTMVLIWQVVRYCKTGMRNSCIWGTLAIVFAYVMRMNSLVVLIAVGIVLIVYAVRTAKPQAAAWLLVMFVAVFAIDGGIRFYYENRSGKEVVAGIPYISYVLMGLQDGENGPGWFNGIPYNEYVIHSCNTELTAVDNERAVKERLQELWEDKPYAIDFFRRKILSQWNAPAYNSFFLTQYFDCEKEELPEIVRMIYYDDNDIVGAFMNRYQFILFLCAAIMTTVSLIWGRHENRLEDHILFIAVIGGFLFSILWEAKSRYVLPYIVYMIPLASVGMWKLQELLAVAMEPLRKQRIHIG